MTKRQVDKIICDWSMATGHSFTEEELNSLVDILAEDKEPACEVSQETSSH